MTGAWYGQASLKFKTAQGVSKAWPVLDQWYYSDRLVYNRSILHIYISRFPDLIILRTSNLDSSSCLLSGPPGITILC